MVANYNIECGTMPDSVCECGTVPDTVKAGVKQRWTALASVAGILWQYKLL